MKKKKGKDWLKTDNETKAIRKLFIKGSDITSLMWSLETYWFGVIETQIKAFLLQHYSKCSANFHLVKKINAF